ncbi:MAG: hypothetical protein RLZ98_699 [Pseudomonadota bacterium]|jgi:protocatechuate 4,5-dioxygenase beta chain
MAEIVAAFGVPHNPNSPALVEKLGPDCEVARLYAEVARNVEAVNPDVIVIFDSDHVNTFFLNHMPTFCVGVTESVFGPNDNTKMPSYEIPVAGNLAGHVRSFGIQEGFDLSLAQEFMVDHSILVPLHFLTPSMKVPIVPIYINGIVPPIPLSRRCHALGIAVRQAIEAWPEKTRVAVVASGSFSLEVGGPKMAPGKRNGVPDPTWLMRVRHLMEQGQVNDLLNEATTSQLAKAGNVGGELLNWIAMLGAIGERKPTFLEPQVEHGHAFAAWRWDR